MEGNRDESSRCIEIAIEAFNGGNYEKAQKFLHKANRLFPSKTASDLLKQVNHYASRSGSNSKRSETLKSTAQSEKSKKAEPATSSYTKEQIELVRKVKKCKNFYDILGVSREATDSNIKKAYKKLALQLHPDKNSAPGAVEAFKSVANAVSTLTDPQKRKDYNMYGISSGHNVHKSTYNGAHNLNRNYHYYTEQEVSTEELFNMFFAAAQQKRPLFVVILVLIFFSVLNGFLKSDPIYKLSQTSKYSVQRFTTHLGVPFFVTETFSDDYQGSIPRLESSVEEDYIYTMKQNCYREQLKRETLITRARSFGSRAQMAHAQDLKIPSCDNLSKLGIKRYTIY